MAKHTLQEFTFLDNSCSTDPLFGMIWFEKPGTCASETGLLKTCTSIGDGLFKLQSCQDESLKYLSLDGLKVDKLQAMANISMFTLPDCGSNPLNDVGKSATANITIFMSKQGRSQPFPLPAGNQQLNPNRKFASLTCHDAEAYMDFCPQRDSPAGCSGAQTQGCVPFSADGSYFAQINCIKPEPKRSVMGLMIGVTVGVVFGIVLVSLFIFQYKYKRTRLGSGSTKSNRPLMLQMVKTSFISSSVPQSPGCEKARLTAENIYPNFVDNNIDAVLVERGPSEQSNHIQNSTNQPPTYSSIIQYPAPVFIQPTDSKK